MTPKKPFDIGDFPVTKLPPGKAYGADDLTRWSHNRAVGASGSGPTKTKAVVMKCKKCKQTTDKIISKYDTKPAHHARCRHCGKSAWHTIVKSRNL